MFWKSFGKYKLVYKMLWKTFGDSWLIRLSFIMRLIHSSIRLIVMPIIISKIITGLVTEDFNRSQQYAIYFIFSSITLGILGSTIAFVGMVDENPRYARAAKSYFTKLVGMDLEYFNNNMAGYLTTATRQYLDNQMILLRKIRDAYLYSVLAFILPVIVIFKSNTKIGLLALILALTQATYLLYASHIHGPLRRKSRDEFKKNSGLISDFISNIIAVKSNGREKLVSKKVGDAIDNESLIFQQRHTQMAKLRAIREVLSVTFFGLLYLLIINTIKTHEISVENAVLCVNYLMIIMGGVYDISDNLEDHDTYIDNVIPAIELIDYKNLIADPISPYKPLKVMGKIELHNVDFSYAEKDGTKVIFENLNLIIPSGQKIGIVGVSGAGKSTLAKLLLRFDDVQKGEILLDGVNLKQYSQAVLREQMAYVPQEPILFHDSILNNIRFAVPEKSLKQIKTAARVAHTTDFIKDLPHGFNSIVGERGVKLSGGQKQRVAIARAVLQEAPVFVLDEATSALDSESEQIIKNSFKDILKGKTAIVIAHRLSTLSEMDRIIVLRNGKIIEDGTHEQLVKNNSEYMKIWRYQQSIGL